MADAAELLARLHERVEQMTTSEDWLAMLRQAARFHDYSLNNLLLIMIQRPEASQVAGYRKWPEFNRFVRKGEKGIAILAPMIGKVEDDSGEKKSVIRGFKVVHVFDVSQTDGEPLPERPRPVLLDGQAPEGLFEFLTGLITEAGYALSFPDAHSWDGGEAKGYTTFNTKRVVIRPGLSPAQQCKTMAHEYGHVTFRHNAMGHRGIGEVEAESLAATFLMAAGLDSLTYSVSYVASWAEGDMKLVTATAGRVVAEANRMIKRWEESQCPTSSISTKHEAVAV